MFQGQPNKKKSICSKESHLDLGLRHEKQQSETLKTGSFCLCFSMERAVWGLKMMGEPVVSELSSRSSEIPGASEPGAKW